MKYDVVTAVHQGKRDYQEDAVAANFAIGADHGFAVLADGMGGHCGLEDCGHGSLCRADLSDEPAQHSGGHVRDVHEALS